MSRNRRQNQNYTPLVELETPDVVRMVLVGRTGAGKSASGNTILGRKAFISKSSPSTVTTACTKEETIFEDKSLYVVDTPGLFDPDRCPEESVREIALCISKAAPGPHAFLFVLCASRFTKEERECVKSLQKIFENSSQYTMALFTHGDDLNADSASIEEFITQSSDLQAFTNQCGGGYHVFNNRTEDPTQVRELLRKINTMVAMNGGRYYTSDMLEEAEAAISDEIERLMAEYPNMTFQNARKRAESDNPFIKGMIVTALAVIGSASGAAGAGASIGGAVGGPLGAALGAAAGIAVAAAIVTITSYRNKNK